MLPANSPQTRTGYHRPKGAVNGKGAGDRLLTTPYRGYSSSRLSEQAQQDRKKAVLNTLTGLVKVSELRDRIDPKAFFMTLNANYPVLCSGNTMDLGLLWGSLSQAHEPNSLAGLFLKFSEAGEKLGFEVREPPELASLPRPDREALLGAFDRSLAAGPGQKRQGASPPPPARTPHPQPLLRCRDPDQGALRAAASACDDTALWNPRGNPVTSGSRATSATPVTRRRLRHRPRG